MKRNRMPLCAFTTKFELISEITLQFGETNTRQKVLTQLMGSIIGEPFFTQLRTQEQLGYLVSARPLFMSVVDGAQFLVQSNVQGAPYLEQRIDSFVQNNWNVTCNFFSLTQETPSRDDNP